MAAAAVKVERRKNRARYRRSLDKSGKGENRLCRCHITVIPSDRSVVVHLPSEPAGEVDWKTRAGPKVNGAVDIERAVTRPSDVVHAPAVDSPVRTDCE